MNKTQKKRLLTVTRRIDALPMSTSVVEDAFQRFRETGELPEHQGLATAVVHRVLQDCGSHRKLGTCSYRESLRILKQMANGEYDPERKSAPVREQLLNEAVYGDSVVRMAARAALKILVSSGIDLTDPDLVEADMELPDYGSAGLHLLGFPDCLAKPPYKRQAQRLFDRFDVLRKRIDRDDRRWFDDMGKAASAFLHHGDLPDDELMREAVLANGEFVGLLGHYCGEGDAEVMAAFDRVARAEGADRNAAVERVRAMAAEGRLISAPVNEARSASDSPASHRP